MEEQVVQVWMAYVAHHPRAVFSPERRRLIERRLKEGYPVAMLMDAIDGNHLDPHCNGENDRFKTYHGVELILRDADHIERFADLAALARPVDPLDAAWERYCVWASDVGHVAALERAAGIYPDELVAAIQQRVEGEPI